MRRFSTLLFTTLIFTAILNTANAWEFALSGEAEYRFRYLLRSGPNDLFGQANSAAVGFNDGAIGFAGYFGGTNTVVAQGYSAKGADAEVADTRVWIYPDMRINPAIRLRGEYWITGGNIYGSYDGAGAGPINGDSWIRNRGYTGWYNTPSPTLPTGMSTGVWEKFWATIDTPWGTLVLGRRPLSFGLGWSTLHQRDSDSEMLGLVVPHGPLTFIFVNQLYENNWIIPNQSSQLDTYNPAGVAAATDKNGIRDVNGAFAVTYRSANVEMGTMSRYVFHKDVHAYTTPGVAPVPAGPNRRDDASASPAIPLLFAGIAPNGFPTVADIQWLLQVRYFKYDNGRFFFNLEYDFHNIDVTRKGGRPLSGWQDAWMIELGTICGPAKFTLANFYHSGHDRRGGLFNTRASTGRVNGTYVMDRYNEFSIFGGCSEPVRPYAFLMGLYGAGNNAFEQRGLPVYLDFLAYAARLDYAVAANMNVFATFMLAERASNTGTYIGQYNGGVSAAVAALRPVPNTTVNANGVVIQTGRIPNVPDNSLGWEVDMGWSWKLLENLTFNGLCALWQPGDWFKWAYVDYSNNNVTAIGNQAFPVNPNRNIDPIFGFQSSMVINF